MLVNKKPLRSVTDITDITTAGNGYTPWSLLVNGLRQGQERTQERIPERKQQRTRIRMINHFVTYNMMVQRLGKQR